MPTIAVNGIRHYYEIRGQGEPVLFIHGLGSSVQEWRCQAACFSRRYRTIVYDVRGFGRSDKPVGPYGIPLFADDASGLLEALDIPSAHVVGFSMGGMIALQMAVTSPEKVRSLTVINSLADFIPRTLKDKMQFIQRHLIVRLLGMRRLGGFLSNRLFPGLDQEALRKGFLEEFGENAPHAYLAALSAVSRWSVMDRLHQLKCPALVLASEMDYWPVSAKKAYVEKMGAELKVVTGSRHAMSMDRPEALNEALSQFLQKVNRQ